MGTRRSRRNKGVKPFYKEHRRHLIEVDHHAIAGRVLARPRYGGAWLDTHCTWDEPSLLKLHVLCEAESDPEGSADAIGRKPTALAHKARELGLTLPREWSRLIAPKRKATSGPRLALAYPYITKITDKHEVVVAVNELIPKAIPGDMRADMCQEILLAIYDGRTSLDDLRARQGSASYFIRKFYKDNLEQEGKALSFSALAGNGDDGRTNEDVAASLSAKAYWHDRMVDRHRGIQMGAQTMLGFTPPDQFEAAWQDQIGRTQIKLHDLGQFLDRDEVEALLDLSEGLPS